MDKLTVRKEIKEVLKELSDMAQPDPALIDQCIAKIKDNNLEAEMHVDMNVLDLLKTVCDTIGILPDNPAKEKGMSMEDISKMVNARTVAPKMPPGLQALVDNIKKDAEDHKARTEAAQPKEDEDTINEAEEECGCGDCIELEEGEEAKLTFTVTKNADGGLDIAFNSSKFSDLEILGAVELFRDGAMDNMNK
tara:strand:- start:1613 stop:2191 length:579 start_codon:yes stop_codon:yes gene_type:complete